MSHAKACVNDHFLSIALADASDVGDASHALLHSSPDILRSVLARCGSMQLAAMPLKVGPHTKLQRALPEISSELRARSRKENTAQPADQSCTSWEAAVINSGGSIYRRDAVRAKTRRGRADQSKCSCGLGKHVHFRSETFACCLSSLKSTKDTSNCISKTFYEQYGPSCWRYVRSMHVRNERIAID